MNQQVDLKLARRLRELLGVLAIDLPRYRRAFQKSGPPNCSHPEGWISICNRTERLIRAQNGPGVACDWWLGSDLHAPEVLPWLGRRLLAAALREWPIEFLQTPRVIEESPHVSFIFTCAGRDRIPQLLRTIETVNAQHDIACECILVDQTPRPIRDCLPSFIKYHHVDISTAPAGWHKSWGYNIGARIASTDILVFQDGDVCVPSRYAAEVHNALTVRGFGAASLQRVLFYLDAATSEHVDADGALARPIIEAVKQNWKGGTIAIRRDAYLAIGGFDEGFVDWGGEDDEFYDRCALIGHCRSGYLPFLHLWHTPQVSRKQVSNQNITRVLPWRLSLPREARADELKQRRFGDMSRPDPYTSYKDSLV